MLLGLAAGALSGLIGIGGGVIIVPALILLSGLSQHQAQGTTLALLIPPVGILAVWTYYKQGFVNLEIAATCVWVSLGGFFRSQDGDQHFKRSLGENLRSGDASHCSEDAFAK